MSPILSSTSKTPSQSSTQLCEQGEQWVSRYDFLKAHGHLLRPRYRPGWVPSWCDGKTPKFRHEDSIAALGTHLDAERISDGQQIFLKVVPRTSPEIEISKYLSSPELRNIPQNHSIPLFDVLDDPIDQNGVILVLPFLRPLGITLPNSVHEMLSFMEQTLEGLVFLHGHQIAHRDCAYDNIMTDGRALYPNGWHPQSWLAARNGLASTGRPALREVQDPRYYFIDFGLSTHGESLAIGEDGHEEAPELSLTVPYDPYKLDVYILGKTYGRLLIHLFARGELDFLWPLIAYMTPKSPHERLTAIQALEGVKELRTLFSEAELSRRLRPLRPESTIDRLCNGAWNLFLDYYWDRRKTKRVAGPLD